MGTKKVQYVYRLMKAQCSCGDKEFTQFINMDEDHGVYFHDQESPLMNANDHVANENIYTFGRCKSLKNPGGDVARGIANSYIPLFGGDLVQSLIGCKCEPMTIVPWINANEEYWIDGAPALTVESELPCYYGGTIKIVLETVDGEEAEAEEEDKDVKDQLPSEVQEKIDSFCDNDATDSQSAGEEAIAAEQEAALQASPIYTVWQVIENGSIPQENETEISVDEGILSQYLSSNVTPAEQPTENKPRLTVFSDTPLGEEK